MSLDRERWERHAALKEWLASRPTTDEPAPEPTPPRQERK